MKSPRRMYLKGILLSLALMMGPTAVVQADTKLAQYQQEAMQTSQAYLTQLGKTMKQTMKKDGPVAAIQVCADKAPAISAEISRQQGLKLTRVSQKVRNPALATPDVWEQQVLAQFQSRLDKGESLQKMSYSEIVTEPEGRYFRFAKALAVKPVCLTCHGSEGEIPAAVKQVLAEKYPFDQATGYRAGELRGAVSIKRALR